MITIFQIFCCCLVLLFLARNGRERRQFSCGHCDEEHIMQGYKNLTFRVSLMFILYQSIPCIIGEWVGLEKRIVRWTFYLWSWRYLFSNLHLIYRGLVFWPCLGLFPWSTSYSSVVHLLLLIHVQMWHCCPLITKTEKCQRLFHFYWYIMIHLW